jgi:hypothetical protein
MIIQTDKPLRPRDPDDFYPTPTKLCAAALDLLPFKIAPTPNLRELIADPGAGSGVWGQAAQSRWPQALIDGCDTRDIPKPAGYDQWLIKDFALTCAADNTYDLVIGNPPYKFAELFVRKALRIVRQEGYVLFLLRLAFLESQTRGRGLWRDTPPLSVHVLVSRPSFIAEGPKAGCTDATAYAIYVWRKGYVGDTALRWLDWDSEPEPQPRLFEVSR